MSFPERILEPVPDYPGVVTSTELRRYKLGIIYSLKVLCCIVCERNTTLSLADCTTHARQHISDSKMIRAARVKEICSRYEVFDKAISLYNIPRELVAPYKGLTTHDGFCCGICEARKTPYYALKQKTMDNHVSEHHKVNPGSNPIRRAPLQSLFQKVTNHRYWFEVDPAFAINSLPDDPFVTTPANHTQIMQAVYDRYQPAKHMPPTSSTSTLKDTQPALYFTGYAAHCQKYEAAKLRELVEYPADDSDFREFADTVRSHFIAFQDQIEDLSQSARYALTADGRDSEKLFVALDESSRPEYSSIMARWFVFVMRLYKMQVVDNNLWYKVTFTKDQLSACQHVMDYIQKKETRHRSGYLMYRMAFAFWFAPTPSYFAHLDTSQFDDPTVRFGALLSLRADGTFDIPRSIAHKLVQIKYMIRVSFLMWAHHQASGDETDNPQSISLAIAAVVPSLKHGGLTPYGQISLAVAHASRYAHTSVHAPNAVWTGETTLSLDGNHIDTNKYKSCLHEFINETESKINLKIFRGRTAEFFGFNITEKTELNDRLPDTSAGYSFLNDPENGLEGLKFNLLKGYIEHCDSYLVKGLHTDADGRKSLSWDDGEAERWLGNLDSCLTDLATLIHMTGGQPARGVETCLMKLENFPHRVRSVYAYRPGVLVFLNMYNKTTSNTTLDRLVAHAVPWRIARMYLALMVLARPLAAILLERTHGPQARVIAETSAFSIRGKEMVSDDLSANLRRFFLRHFGATNIGIRAFRHFTCAGQKRKLKHAFAPIEKVIAVLDAQAGHSSETAREHYAIEPAELLRFTSTTLLAHVTCSQIWFPHILPAEDLTEDEKKASVNSTSNSTVPGVLPAIPELKQMVTEAVEEAFTSERVTTLLATSVAAKVQANTTSGSTTPSLPQNETTPDSDEPAPYKELSDLEVFNHLMTQTRHRLQELPMRVQPKHKVLLERYLNSPNASWTSRTQAAAVAHVLSRSESSLIILPTGGGKSAVFGMIPLIESGVTVIAFPGRSIMDDQIASSIKRQRKLAQSQKSRGRDITLKEWAPDQPNDEDGLYAIQYERLEHVSFKSWMNQQINNRRFSRLILDEVHNILTSKGFRDVMKHVGYLTTKRVPLVALTATLPPEEEEPLCAALGHPTWRIFRETTERPNIEYHAARYASEGHARIAFNEHVQRLSSQLLPGEGMMIMARTIDDVNALATRFNALPYHRGLSKAEASDNLASWLSGQRQIIVGTTALGTGVHHEHCRAVLHWNSPFSMFQWCQETGRGGRDGKPAAAIVFDWNPVEAPYTEDPTGWTELSAMLAGTRCMRQYRSAYIDGQSHAVTCLSGPGYIPCGRCQKALVLARQRDGFAGLAGPEPRATFQLVDPDTHIVEQIPRLKPLSVPPTPENYDDDVVMEYVGRPMLEPPQPTGRMVISDAAAAIARQQELLNNPLEYRNPDVSTATPYCIQALLKAKTYLIENCFFCCYTKKETRRHPFWQCKETCHKGYQLHGLKYHGSDLSTAKSVTYGRWPKDNQICFYCWWPWAREHDHPPSVRGDGCTAKDVIPQLCWFLVTDARYRAIIMEHFSVNEDVISDPQQYMCWLVDYEPKQTFNGAPYIFTNAHRVVIYVMFIDNRYCQLDVRA